MFIRGMILWRHMTNRKMTHQWDGEQTGKSSAYFGWLLFYAQILLNNIDKCLHLFGRLLCIYNSIGHCISPFHRDSNYGRVDIFPNIQCFHDTPHLLTFIEYIRVIKMWYVQNVYFGVFCFDFIVQSNGITAAYCVFWFCFYPAGSQQLW